MIFQSLVLLRKMNDARIFTNILENIVLAIFNFDVCNEKGALAFCNSVKKYSKIYIQEIGEIFIETKNKLLFDIYDYSLIKLSNHYDNKTRFESNTAADVRNKDNSWKAFPKIKSFFDNSKDLSGDLENVENQVISHHVFLEAIQTMYTLASSDKVSRIKNFVRKISDKSAITDYLFTIVLGILNSNYYNVKFLQKSVTSSYEKFIIYLYPFLNSPRCSESKKKVWSQYLFNDPQLPLDFTYQMLDTTLRTKINALMLMENQNLRYSHTDLDNTINSLTLGKNFVPLHPFIKTLKTFHLQFVRGEI